MPSQNPGMAMKSTDSVRATPSGTLLGLNALRIPTGSPTNQEITRASSPISALIGPRWAISSATVSPRKNDLPRRPAAMSTSHRPYWTGRGSDSPRSAMIRTRSSFDIRAWPSTPRMATSGSPGRIRRTTKMMTETPSSVPAAYAARRPRYFLTRAAPGSGLRHPDRVPPHDVVDPEVRRRVLSSHPVVPGERTEPVDVLRDLRRRAVGHGLDGADLSPAPRA